MKLSEPTCDSHDWVRLLAPGWVAEQTGRVGGFDFGSGVCAVVWLCVVVCGCVWLCVVVWCAVPQFKVQLWA